MRELAHAEFPELVGRVPALSTELAACLAEEPVLDAFRSLATADQRNFIRWIGAGESPAERDRRGLILKEALRQSPLGWESQTDLPNRRPGQEGPGGRA